MKGYKRKRGENSWRLAVYLGRDEHGKKKYYYETFHGKEREADKRLAMLVASFATGEQVQPAKITLADFLNRWLRDYAKQAVRQTTYDFYEQLIRVHIVPALGNKPLAKLRPLDVQTFYAAKLQEGLSPKTVKHIHGLLREAYRHAVQWQLVAKSPIDAVVPPSVPTKPPLVWTPEQAAAFLEVARSHRLYAAFLLAVATGMRRGEILGLRWQDVDLDRGLVFVQQNLVPTREGLRFQEPKSPSSRRAIKLPPEAITALREHWTKQLEERRIYDSEYNDKGLVFCAIDGSPLHPRSFDRVFQSLVSRTGLPKITLHGLRHTHATLLLLAGLNPKIVAERLGHSEISTTMNIYSHVIPTMQDQAAAAISILLRSAMDGQKMANPDSEASKDALESKDSQAG